MGLHHGRQAAFVPFAAFAYFRWNTLRLRVLTSSILSTTAAVCLFLLLVISAETHIHCEGAIKCFKLLSINFNAIFLFFLTKRNQSMSEYNEFVEDMNDPPPASERRLRRTWSNEQYAELQNPQPSYYQLCFYLKPGKGIWDVVNVGTCWRSFVFCSNITIQ